MHASGRGARFARAFAPEAVVLVEEFPSRGEALSRESEIKRMGKAAKERLIAGRDARLGIPEAPG